MAETAATLADEVLPERPLRQWVLSLPHALRFLLASDPAALTLVLGVVYRTISRHLIDQAGVTRATDATGAVTLVQRFGSALHLNVHFHVLFRDGVLGVNYPGRCRAAASVPPGVCPRTEIRLGGLTSRRRARSTRR